MIPLVLADHTLISAVPFLVPALVIIGFLGFHVIRDRRSGGGDEADWAHDEGWPAEPGVVDGDDDGPRDVGERTDDPDDDGAPGAA